MLYLDKIIPIYFIISLAIGILLVYLYQPNPKIIYKYPTPNKAKDITYQDKKDSCFKYKPSKVNCPLDKSKIINIDK
jgi:hypothetical protein